MLVNRHKTDKDLTDHFQEQSRRIKSLERTIGSVAMANTYSQETEPWPAEAPNGDHASAVGTIWFNSFDNTVWRWNSSGQWSPITPVPAPTPRSFWYLSAGFNVGGAGVNVDINTWVDDGAINHPDISMDSGQNIIVARTGLYRITCGLTYPVNSTGRRYLQIFPGATGGAVIIGDWQATSSTGVVHCQLSRIYPFEAEDIFRVTAAQDSGSTLALIAGNTFSYLQVEYVVP
jgi:hypothetical protein